MSNLASNPQTWEFVWRAGISAARELSPRRCAPPRSQLDWTVLCTSPLGLVLRKSVLRGEPKTRQNLVQLRGVVGNSRWCGDVIRSPVAWFAECRFRSRATGTQVACRPEEDPRGVLPDRSRSYAVHSSVAQTSSTSPGTSTSPATLYSAHAIARGVLPRHPYDRGSPRTGSRRHPTTGVSELRRALLRLPRALQTSWVGLVARAVCGYFNATAHRCPP